MASGYEMPAVLLAKATIRYLTLRSQSCAGDEDDVRSHEIGLPHRPGNTLLTGVAIEDRSAKLFSVTRRISVNIVQANNIEYIPAMIYYS